MKDYLKLIVNNRSAVPPGEAERPPAYKYARGHPEGAGDPSRRQKKRKRAKRRREARKRETEGSPHPPQLDHNEGGPAASRAAPMQPVALVWATRNTERERERERERGREERRAQPM